MISSPPGEGKHAALGASVLPFPLAGDQQAMLVIYPQIRLQFFGSTSEAAPPEGAPVNRNRPDLGPRL